MKMIKKLLEERKYRKKYNTIKLVYDDLLIERQNLIEENDFLRKQVKKLTKERAMLRGRNTKKELSNDKGSTSDSRNRLSISEQDNERSSGLSDSKKLSTTTN